MAPLTNDTAALVPRIPTDGPALSFEWPALRIGIAEYDEGPTGCTVVHLPAGAALAVDVRGGSAAVVGDYGWTNAVCFAGGSIYGLEATAGVAAELFAERGYSTRWDNLALASGAIVYDYRGRDNAVYPDKALGRAALRGAAPGRFPLGRRGAGRSVTAGKGFDLDRGEPAGQGGAFRQVGATKILVLSVVNAIGAIVDRGGRVVRGHVDPASGRREAVAVDLERRLAAGESPAPPTGNTTLTFLATNVALDRRSLEQWGKQVHASMARAIQPFHALEDGDALFAVTTAEVEDGPGPAALGVLASELAWDAVLSSFAHDGATRA